MCTGLPHCLAAALAVYWLIIVELLCKACLATVHADTQRKTETLSIVLKSLNTGISLSFSSLILMLPLCSGRHFLSFSLRLPPSCSPLSAYISFTPVPFLPFCLFSALMFSAICGNAFTICILKSFSFFFIAMHSFD